MRETAEASRSGGIRRRRWSWQLGTIAGIPIRVHVSLALLFAWIAVSYSISGIGPSATALGVLLVLTIFTIIVAHELAHAIMARRFGVRTHEILLLPIGGIASLERIPDLPRQELAVALVGPALNLVIAGILWFALSSLGATLDPTAVASSGEAFAVQLLWINVVLAVFNLLPAFPMDGGRALRALLSMRLGRERATEIAAGLGKLLAIAIGLLGLTGNPWLILIALIVWLGARHEAEVVRLRAAIAGMPVSAAMTRQVDTVTPVVRLDDAARILVESGRSELPIVERGRTVGVLTRADVAAGISSVGPEATIERAPHHAALLVTAQEPLAPVFDQLIRRPDTVAVVTDDTGPIGIVTPEQLAMFVSLHGQAREVR